LRYPPPLEVGARLRGAMGYYSIFGNIRGYSSLPEDNAYIERYNIDEILNTSSSTALSDLTDRWA